MTNTMPSNSEQLLGAILVRKDIFNRFETTMNDTCLDANNLLEYLFSLYNSTASPSERDNFPPPKDIGFIRRDLNHNKKGASRVHQAFPYQNNTTTSQLPPSTVPKKLSEKGNHQSLATNGHRKKLKTEQSIIPEQVNFLAESNDYYSQSLVLKQFEGQPVFPDTIHNTALSMKMESQPVFPDTIHNTALSMKMALTPEGDSPHAETTSLPPLSQIQQHSSRPYSPTSVEYSNTLPTSPHDHSQHLVGVDVRIDPSSEVKIDVEGGLQGVAETPLKIKGIKRSPKSIKRSKLKGLSTDDNGGNIVEYEGRKKRHPCFCGAMFTRADNLKRHIRKCHEEKLEKLNPAPLDFDTDNSSAQAMDFSQSLDVSDQAGLEDLPEAQDSQDFQQSQQQQQSDEHKEKQHLQQNIGTEKLTEDAKWPCFCGQIFDHHHQLMEHAKTHDDT